MFGSHCSYVLHNRDMLFSWASWRTCGPNMRCADTCTRPPLQDTQMAFFQELLAATERTCRKENPKQFQTSPLHRKPMKSQWFKHLSANCSSISAALRKNGADAGAIGIEVGLQFFKDFLWHSADLSKSLDPKNIGYSLGLNQQNMGILWDSGDFSVESIKHSSSHGFLPCFLRVVQSLQWGSLGAGNRPCPEHNVGVGDQPRFGVVPVVPSGETWGLICVDISSIYDEIIYVYITTNNCIYIHIIIIYVYNLYMHIYI